MSHADPSTRAAGLNVFWVKESSSTPEPIAGILRRQGHHATTLSGTQALRSMEQGPPDVILLDVRGAASEGHELLRRVHACAEPRRPLLIALTRRGSEDDIRWCREAGIDLHLSRPVDVPSLLGTLRRFEKLLRNTPASDASMAQWGMDAPP